MRIIWGFIKLYLYNLFLFMNINANDIININSETTQPTWQNTNYGLPYFDNMTKRDITATVGQSAKLHCVVRNLGDRAVSWIRKRDLHILTVGILTYTNDQRYQSLHADSSDEWTLRITSPQPRDSGIYECQVSTEPKISLAFRLTVIVSRAEILGNSEVFIKSGNDINLTCVAYDAPGPPSFIYWYKGPSVINYSQRGGISVLTERQTKTSKLVISRAMSSDSGNYTCLPSNSDPASVMVHVINGEHPAAMQHGNSSSNSIHSLYCNRNSNFLTFHLSKWLLSSPTKMFSSIPTLLLVTVSTVMCINFSMR
ncbi:unnamed protein product [Chironomus riparius]|uniref:Ig-like domain-containing protein n=1 Tax=Chironomus riparius TaxID=315576 RepID=A0A9N9RYM6_9DIPT|nr:unnamed protein product [Chironomus riparius]